jgi:hypothetical protein
MSAERGGIAAGDERGTVGESQCGCVSLRGAQGRQADVGADAERVGNFVQQGEQDRARAGADVGDARRPPRDRKLTEDFQRQFNHRLGVGPRHQRGVRQPKGQAPKLPHAEDARDRLAREAPLCIVLELHGFRRCERPCGLRDHAG